MTATASIQNADRLLAKLRRFPEAARVKVREAMAAQADEIIGMMRRLVPVDEGDLRDSIGWRWGMRAPKGSISVGTLDVTGRGDMTITIYAGNAKAYYARWQEFGTVKMAANPFFYPAWRASRKAVRRRVQAAMRRAAREVAASGS